jgi:hypothetical protein
MPINKCLSILLTIPSESRVVRIVPLTGVSADAHLPLAKSESPPAAGKRASPIPRRTGARSCQAGGRHDETDAVAQN